MNEIEIPRLPPGRFEPVVPQASMRAFETQLARARKLLAGRTLWHVNSTATGGGVAEMLQSVLCYLVGAGMDTRWAVVDAADDFLVVTKRIHHMLHDRPGDGGQLGAAERELYLASLAPEAAALTQLVRPGDVVLLHDPQTLGLAQPLREAGARLVWICHVGVDRPGKLSRAAWRFLMPYALACDVQVFSRRQYVWEGLEERCVQVVPPCIDVFSPKNQALEPGVVAAILGQSAVAADGIAAEPIFLRQDGSPARVRSTARMVEEGQVPRGRPVVTQISRWDPLKDHRGVMRAFVEHVPEESGAHLILAGPDPGAVADDPEGRAVLDELVAAWQRLPRGAAERIHIASLPMDDVDENAAIVNALQRHAAVIVQKSLAEGFGLTVAEAMWKARPVAASRVGGIQDQIENGETGVLVDDPADLPALGRALTGLLTDAKRAARLGQAARESVADRYLVPPYLTRYLGIVETLL